jgi:hypothetical protein
MFPAARLKERKREREKEGGERRVEARVRACAVRVTLVEN